LCAAASGGFSLLKTGSNALLTTVSFAEQRKDRASRSTKSRSGNVVVGRSGDVVVVRADHEQEDIAKLEAGGKISPDTAIVFLVRFSLP
jgi:hypothetical protein